MGAYRRIRKKVKKCLIDLSKKNSAVRMFFRSIRYIKNRCRYLLYHFSHINDKKIIFESFMGRKYSDNPRAVYEYMLRNERFKDFDFVWAFKDMDKHKEFDILDNSRTQIVKYGSRDYYKAYGTSKYWVSNSRIPEAIYKKENQVYLQCWHGTPLKKLGYDIEVEGKNALNSNKDIRKKYKADAKRYSYMTSSSGFCTEKFISAFNLKAWGKENIVIEEGFPRNDILSNYRQEDVGNIKEKLGIAEDKKVILYAPTWRDNQHDSSKGYVYKNKLDFDMMQRELSESYVVLFRAHYFVANNFDFEKYCGFVYDVSSYEYINDLYIVSDLLVTDYSSVFFDYAVLRKPIIFFMYDLDEYAEDISVFYLSLDELPGNICTNEEQLLDEIKNNGSIIHHRYDDFNKKYNYLDDGQATKRVVEKVFL